MLRRLLVLFVFALPLSAANPLTPEEFLDRYGLVDGPAPAPNAARADDVLGYQFKQVFDESEARFSRFGASVIAMKNHFRERAAAAREPVRDSESVRRAIDETFGVSRLGEGIEITKFEPLAAVVDGGTLHDLRFTFGAAGFGEAVIGVPEEPNGILLIALHGCLSSPDAVMTNVRSYVNSFGLRAMQRGFTVVAPYVMSQCGWIHNLDWAGSMSGVSVFGYELAKIRELTRWAEAAYGLRSTAIWGISLGGQYAMLASALNPTLFDVTVISAAAADYEESYLAAFDTAPLDAAQPLGANTQIELSKHFSRADVIGAILPRQVVFEMTTSELTPGAMAFVAHADELALDRHAPRPRVVAFHGEHETNPEATAEVLEGLFAGRRRSPR